MPAGSRPSPPAGRSAESEAFVLHLIRGEVTADQGLHRLRSEIAALQPLLPPSPAAGRLFTALVATRPDAITDDIAQALASVIAQSDLTGSWQPGLDAAFELLPLLVPTPAAVALPSLIAAILGTGNLHQRWARRATTLLEELYRWRPELVEPSSLVSLAEAAPEPARDEIFKCVVVPGLLADPSSLDVGLLARACALPGEKLNARYLATAIEAHLNSPADARAAAGATVEHAFPLREAWRRLSKGRALRILCIQNITDGQGDEIVRVVPLLQSLLGSHDDTTIRLITDRPYLYGHPRLETIGFDDRERIVSALSSTPEVLIEFSERKLRHLNYDTDLIDAVARLRDSMRPLLDIQAGKGWDDFTFDQVRLGGQEWAGALELDRRSGASAFVPIFRLMAELGLPPRLGQPAASGSILQAETGPEGDDSPDALLSGNHWLFAGNPQRNRPSLTERPTKRAWITFLERSIDSTFYELLANACRSEDPDIRLAATRALGRLHQPDTLGDLLALLDDPSRSVRGAAADGLLTHHRSSLGSQGIPDTRTLESYRLIGETPPNWQQILSSGHQARPALEAALWGDEPVIRREAAVILELINHQARSQAHAPRQ